MLEIIKAEPSHLDNWDYFVSHSINGTLFHKRKFLSYHGPRFSDQEQFLVVLNGQTPWAQLSLAVQTEKDGRTVACSPYGASYGGFVFAAPPTYKKGKELAIRFIDFLKTQKIEAFRLTPPIPCCTTGFQDTFTFNLLEVGFISINRDVSSVAVLSPDKAISDEFRSKTRNHIRKAQKNNISIKPNAPLKDFYITLEDTFRRHGVEPTHTKEELEQLALLHPEEVLFHVAYKDHQPIAGMACFVMNKAVISAFYMCQIEAFQSLHGLTWLVAHTLEQAQREGFAYFDFGTSTINMMARENVFSFKEHFTRYGQFRETFEWQNEK